MDIREWLQQMRSFVVGAAVFPFDRWMTAKDSEYSEY